MRLRGFGVLPFQRLFRVSAILFFAFAIFALNLPHAVAQTLSPSAKAKLQKNIEIIQIDGGVIPVGERFALALGLQHPFTRKGATHKAKDATYGMSIGLSDPTRMVFFRQNKDGLTIFATTLDLELLSAATLRDNVVTTVPVNTVREVFDETLRIWSEDATLERQKK